MSAPSKRDQPIPQMLSETAAWHPDEAMLAAFAQGSGSERAFEQIELHLAHCDSCVATIESLDYSATDSLLHPNWRQTVGIGANDRDAIDSSEEVNETKLPVQAIGPYRLKKIIGEGGMGIVYLAEQQEPIQRTVALKILKPGLTTAPFIKRFKSERQTLAILKHPYIAKVLDAGETSQGRMYFVMEFLEGIPITEYCNDHCSTISDRLELFGLVCSAVEHAHQKAIIHRDLKPSNVLVSEINGQPQPKVIDFGISKTLHLTDRPASVTCVGQIVGTLEYLSPEQLYFDSSNVDTRTDVYQLGAVLYELLTNEPPLGIHNRTNTSIDDIARVIREREPTLPSIRLASSDSLDRLAQDRSTTGNRLVKRVRGDLDWITAKALEKKRSKRYQSVRELANDVQRHLNNELLSIAAPSFAYRIQKSFRRHKIAVGFAAVMTVFMIFLAGLAGWLNVALSNGEASREQLAYDNSVANVRNAQHYFKKNNVSEATSLLRSLIPDSDRQNDLRDFEWYYWWDQCHPEQLLRTLDYEAPMHDIEYSPNGSMYAVAAGGKRTATLFDATTHEIMFELRPAAPVAGCSVDFSLDNRDLIIACSEGQVFVVDTKTCEIRIKHSLGKLAIRDVAIDPMGRFVAVGGESIWILNAKMLDQKPLRLETQEPVGSLSFSPDGQFMVAGEDPNPELKQVCQLVLFPCGERWKELDRKNAVPSHLTTTHLSSLLVMPDNQTVVCGYTYGAALTWKIIGREDSNRLKLSDEPERIIIPDTGAGLTNVKLSKDERYFGAARFDGTIQIWELNEKAPSYYRGPKGTPFAKLPGHSNAAKGVEFLPSGNGMASVGRDEHINFWEIERDRDSLLFGSHAPTAIDFRDGNLLVGNSQELICWDTLNENIRYRVPLSGSRMTYSVEFFYDQRNPRAVTLDGQGTVRILDAPDGSLVHQFDLPVNSRIAVNACQQEFVVATGDNRLQRYGFDGELIELIGSHKERISRIAVGRSGEIVSCSKDGAITFWDSDSQFQKTYQSEIWPMAIAYSDVKRCIAVGAGSKVYVFNTTTDEQHVLRGHTGEIRCLDFSKNGSRLASGGNDETVILWETKTWKDVATFDPFVDRINCLKFSPDDQTLVVGTAKNFVWQFNAPRIQR